MEVRSLNEAQLARAVEMAQPTMHKLMSGATSDPRISTLVPIADYFGVSIDQLLGLAPLDAKMVISTEKSAHSAIKLPVLPWDHLIEHRENLSKLTLSNWNEWITINKPVNKNGYATRVQNNSFPAPFSNNTVISVDPILPVVNGCYVLVKAANTNSISIKKCLFDGSDIWLMSLIEGIQPILFNKDNWLILGVILEAYSSLYGGL